MNLSEINSAVPRYWHVLMVGIPLALLTALLPLYFNALWHFSHRTLHELRRISKNPLSDKVFVVVNLFLAAVVAVLCATAKYFRWGPTVGFVVWAVFAHFAYWILQSRMFWVHWFAAMIMLPLLVLLVYAGAASWSAVPIGIYWLLRDWLILKAFAVGQPELPSRAFG